MPAPELLRRCTDCTGPIWSGQSPRCPGCWKARKRRASRECQQRRFAADPSLRERVRDYTRERRQADPERVKAELQSHRARYRQKYLDMQKVANANRRALAWACEGVLTLAEWQEAKTRADGCCTYCGVRPEVPTIDHQIPLSRGGRNDGTNIVLACLDCNNRKHTLTAEEYVSKLAGEAV